MNIILRTENPNDHYAVEELTREAFWKTYWGSQPKICDEHLLTHRLRTCASFVPELSVVAEIGDSHETDSNPKASGKLAGHIIYSKSKIIDGSCNQHEMLTFGPLAVHPAYQGKGIGKALTLHTFDIARQMGYRAVIIFGHADYYPRVGFKRGADFGITTPDGNTFDPFMVRPLFEGALDGIHGRFYIDPVYESLTQEDALKFDKKFPPKEVHQPILIEVLLNRLQPVARAAIKSLDFESLTEIQTKSQREISAIAGIDAPAIETIRNIMKENGLRWGC